MGFLLVLFFVLSRLFFLTTGDVFFDSTEYLARFQNSSLLNALIHGHTPLHMGYVMICWPIFQVAQYIGLNPVAAILFMQIILALVTVVMMQKTVLLLTSDKALSKRVGWLMSVVPVFWIVNEAVMMETTYLFFWMISLFLLLKSFQSPNSKWKYLFWSSLSWMMAFWTHNLIIIWIPLFVYFIFARSKEQKLKYLWAGLATLVFASVINAFALSLTYQTNFTHGLHELYVVKMAERAHFDGSLEAMARYLRNWLIPLGYNNSWVLMLTAATGCFFVFRNKPRFIPVLLFWIAPSVIANQWWDSLLFGRHALIATLGIVLMATFALRNTKIFLSVFICLLLISLGTVSLYRQGIPYLQVRRAAVQLEQGGLLIESHFARPQMTGVYKGQTIFVEEPGWPSDTLIKKIADVRRTGKKVYVTGQALSEPYGLYSGPFLHPISLSYRKEKVLEPLLRDYQFSEAVRIGSGENLSIYEVVDKGTVYPEMIQLSDHRRRIDWMDPLWRISELFLARKSTL